MSHPLFEKGDWWSEEAMLIGLSHLFDRVRVPYFLGVLARGSGHAVLEIGAGGGQMAQMIAAHGYDVIALDPSSIAMAEAVARVPEVAFTAAVGESLPFPDEAFDAVICSEVLEHVTLPRRVVAEASRVLKPKGQFVFSTPNRTALSRLLLIDIAQRWEATRILPSELHRWSQFITPAELGEYLDDVGIRIAQLEGVSLGLHRLPRALFALASLRLGRIDFTEAGDQIDLKLSRFRAVAYLGYGRKVGAGAR